MVQELDESPCRVAYVTRGRSISMGFGGLCNLYPVGLQKGFPFPDVRRFGHNKTHVIQSLRIAFYRTQMESQIVRSPGQVNRLRIGFPFHRVPQKIHIEPPGLLHIRDAQGNVMNA